MRPMVRGLIRWSKATNAWTVIVHGTENDK
jgi:hypothetical protein